MDRLFINAVNLSSGGGLKVLNDLLSAPYSDKKLIIFVDSRANIPNLPPSNYIIYKVKPNIINRLFTDFKILVLVTSFDKILYLGSLPPIFPLKAPVYLFIQNRYLLQQKNLTRFKFKTFLRLFIESIYLKLFSINVDYFLVQTESMKTLLHNSAFSYSKPIIIKSLYSFDFNFLNNNLSKDYDFIYIASGDPHKNHINLLKAWILLSNENIYPSLLLTIDEMKFPKIALYINEVLIKYKLNIINKGSLSERDVKFYYQKSFALIYPSIFESFGIPLLDASNMGLKILASELDYVHDVVLPNFTFDPFSPRSIARAVKRYMGITTLNSSHINGRDFIEYISNGTDK